MACENVKSPRFFVDFNYGNNGKFILEKFETFWKDVVGRHRLQGNNWILLTYQMRRMSANAYQCDKFFVGIRTTSLCEGVNSCIKMYVRRKNFVVELLYNLG
uniref:Protein FAR1-RELATED SEQUENCE n=1 Tax=Cajanus cajan TaxID=3821 RepID=A0A151RJ55_CAJCA|nr:hypothetical protein KK1_035952 [Cajanus cajan]KYP42625.1 hypothetical protein KK1_035955 [Cajanus cajan]